MSLYETVDEAFDSANESDIARRIFEEIDGSALELVVTDGENVHIVFQDGTAQVRSSSTQDELDVHSISGTENAFEDLFAGSVRIVDATWQGRIQAEVYHGRPDLYFALQQSIKIHVPALEPEPF